MEYASLRYLNEHVGVPVNPVLSNILVYEREDGAIRAQAQNGRYAVDVPCDLPLMLINADRITSVWAACKAEPRVSLGEKYLTVTSDRIRARVPLADVEGYPRVDPTPKTAHSADGLGVVLGSLLPYVADDASRPWATSVCITATHAYATNNVIIARAAIDTGVAAPINIPGRSVEAILTCGEIEDIGADDHSVTFYMAGDIWVRCLLVSGEWPTGTADGMLDLIDPAAWLEIHPDFESMLRVAAKLANERHPVVAFRDNGLYLEDESLVAVDLAPLPDTGKVNAKMAALVFDKATHVQWHTPRQDVHAFKAGPTVGVFGGHR